MGYRSRPHQDLDLVIARDDCAAAQHALSGLGFQPDLRAVPGLPARLVLVGSARAPPRVPPSMTTTSDPLLAPVDPVPSASGDTGGFFDCRGHWHYWSAEEDD